MPCRTIGRRTSNKFNQEIWDSMPCQTLCFHFQAIFISDAQHANPNQLNLTNVSVFSSNLRVISEYRFNLFARKFGFSMFCVYLVFFALVCFWLYFIDKKQRNVAKSTSFFRFFLGMLLCKAKVIPPMFEAPLIWIWFYFWLNRVE